MSNDFSQLENTIGELRSSSRISLSMVILGAACLVGSLIYSATRLAPLEEEVREKTLKIESLAATESEYLESIENAKKEYDSLRKNIEKLYAVKVTKDNYVFELKATAKATGNMTSKGPRYNFSIIVNAPKVTLSKIKKITYLFDHPSFGNKNKKVSTDSRDNFKVEYYGWGCLTKVNVSLEFKNGEIKKIDFDMCKSLGPQWLGNYDNNPSSTRKIEKTSEKPSKFIRSLQ